MASQAPCVDLALSRRRARAAARTTEASPWPTVLRAAAVLAAAMGLGRFAYTPILPLMHAHAGLSARDGASLATANYVGYLLGAAAGILVPRLVRSAVVLRASLLVLAATLAAMPATHDVAVWAALRLVAGVCSALVFMIAVTAALQRLRGEALHLAGLVFGGVGVGIALSGLLVLVLRSISTWQVAWVVTAAVALALGAAGCGLTVAADGTAPNAGPAPAAVPVRWFVALLASYTLEGTGYIIAGTFLVAAIGSGAAGSSAWIVVGLAAVPSAAVWALLSRRWSRASLLLAALLVQAAGIALPALVGGVGPALASAACFGGTFLGVSTLTIAIASHLRIPRAVAILTTGYSVGQILGPLVVAPLLTGGYHGALLIGAGIVLAAALATWPLVRSRRPVAF